MTIYVGAAIRYTFNVTGKKTKLNNYTHSHTCNPARLTRNTF